MSQSLCRLQPARPEMLVSSTPEGDRLVREHFAYLQGLTDRGIFLLAGRTLNTDSTSFGIVLFTAKTEEKASRIVDEDPAVRADVFWVALFPYHIALVSEKLRA